MKMETNQYRISLINPAFPQEDLIHIPSRHSSNYCTFLAS